MVEEDPKDIEMKEYSQEDQAAVKGGGMLQQMMQMEEEESSEDEKTEEGTPVESLGEMEKLRKRLKEAGLEDTLEEPSQLADWLK